MGIFVLVKSAREWMMIYSVYFSTFFVRILSSNSLSLAVLIQADSERNALVFQCTCTNLYLWDHKEKSSETDK